MGEPIRIGRGVMVPAAALSWRAVRSSGPGGQNVNKVASKVELRVDVLFVTQIDDRRSEQKLAAAGPGRSSRELDRQRFSILQDVELGSDRTVAPATLAQVLEQSSPIAGRDMDQERRIEESRALEAQQLCARQIDVLDTTRLIESCVTDRRKIVQIGIAIA